MRLHRHILGPTLIGLWLALALPAFADDIADAEQAINKQDYATAVSLLQPLANNGDPQGMLGMGRLYENGWGVPQDMDKAFHWYDQAIKTWAGSGKQGDPRAYASIGVLYQKGLGVEANRAMARKLYREAFKLARPLAEQGDVESQHLLGMLYSSGKGTQKDIYSGVEWLGRAGEAGHITAIKMLIYIYDCGCRGLPKDDEKAEYWRGKLLALESAS